MRVIKRGALVQFWQNHPDARASLESWYAVMRQANWKTPAHETGVPQSRFGRKKNSVQHRRQQVPFNCTSELLHSASLRPALIDTFGIRQRGVETMSTTIIELDAKTYGQLLGRTLPHVIHSNEECDRLTNELMRLDESED